MSERELTEEAVRRARDVLDDELDHMLPDADGEDYRIVRAALLAAGPWGVMERQNQSVTAPALKPLDRKRLTEIVARELASFWPSAVLDTDSLMLLLAERIVDALMESE